MNTDKMLPAPKINLAKHKLTEDDVSPVIQDLSEKVKQLDGLIRCLTEQQYDFGKKLKQIDLLLNQGNGIIINDDDTKLGHLNSLTKLAEKTIVDADNLAESIRKELETKAKSESANIIARAEEKARIDAEKIIAEAKYQARAAASQEAENILGGINEIKGIFDKAYQSVLDNLST